MPPQQPSKPRRVVGEAPPREVSAKVKAQRFPGFTQPAGVAKPADITTRGQQLLSVSPSLALWFSPAANKKWPADPDDYIRTRIAALRDDGRAGWLDAATLSLWREMEIVRRAKAMSAREAGVLGQELAGTQFITRYRRAAQSRWNLYPTVEQFLATQRLITDRDASPIMFPERYRPPSGYMTWEQYIDEPLNAVPIHELETPIEIEPGPITRFLHLPRFGPRITIGRARGVGTARPGAGLSRPYQERQARIAVAVEAAQRLLEAGGQETDLALLYGMFPSYVVARVTGATGSRADRVAPLVRALNVGSEAPPPDDAPSDVRDAWKRRLAAASDTWRAATKADQSDAVRVFAAIEAWKSAAPFLVSMARQRYNEISSGAQEGYWAEKALAKRLIVAGGEVIAMILLLPAVEQFAPLLAKQIGGAIKMARFVLNFAAWQAVSVASAATSSALLPRARTEAQERQGAFLALRETLFNVVYSLPGSIDFFLVAMLLQHIVEGSAEQEE